MNKLSNWLLVLILMVICSCSLQRVSSDSNLKRVIPYILPDSVGKLLIGEVLNKEGNVYFFLSKLNNDIYSIYASTIRNGKSDIWVENTTRRLFLDGKFYPILFDYDSELGTRDTAEDIVKQYKSGEHLVTTHRFTLYHGVHIDFKRDGTIVYVGNK